jgi:AraC-like DNA-binding protein
MGALMFESDDLERTEEFLSRAYAAMRIGSSTPAESHARISRHASASVSVDLVQMNFEMSYEVGPLGRIGLCSMHTGFIRDHAASAPADTYGPGDVFSLAPPDEPYRGRVDRARYHVTLIAPELLAQVASAASDREPDAVRLTGHRPRCEEAARRLQGIITHLRDHVLDAPDLHDQPLVLSTAAQYLAASVLSAFPHTAPTEETARDRRDAHPLTVRRAVAHIEAHADRELTVADIAAAAHVTTRALQYAFRRHLGTTPMRYLRRVRLAAAHEELLRAGPGRGVTVTTVAARWGFAHPGRFAREYRAAYGRRPSHTLRA